MAASNKKTTNSGRNSKKNAGKPGRPRKSSAPMKEPESFIRSEVTIILSFAAAVLLFLSNFHLCGVAGDFLRGLQLGVFGMAGFAFPLLLFLGICFYLSNRGNAAAMLKLAAAVAAFLTLCGFAQLLFGRGVEEEQGIFECYRLSSAGGMGGGLVGGAICVALKFFLGTMGAYLVLGVCFIISAVCITERSFVRAVKKKSDAAYQYAREDMDRRRERQEEKRRLRAEQKVRGVNLDSTDLWAEELNGEGEEDYEGYEEYAEEYPEYVKSSPNHTEAEQEQMQSDLEYSASVSPADVFRGKICLPPEYPNDDDTAPFDVDDVIRQEESAQSLVTEGSRAETNYDPIEPEDKGMASGIVGGNSFVIPEGEKRVVTANGKIIETETEALQKKLELKKQEARQAAEDKGTAVSQQLQQEDAPKKEYVFPPLNLLKRGSHTAGNHSEKEYKETAIKLQQTLHNFGVGVTVTNISCGPAVTRYELHPEQGVKVSRIVGLADDIKLSLAAEDIRIEAPIPGKSAVGIEVPNKENNTVYLRDLLESENFKNHQSRLAFAVGKDIGGQVVVTDIAKMPHLLIAGATGSGKSVCINTLIMSIIYKSKPEDVKLIMVDPKVVELSVYNGIPHLLIPVVTDPKKASGALNWAVAEMTDRYKKFAQYNVRDLKGYNAKIENIKDIDDDNKPTKLPQIVIIVDELADLMMVCPGDVEDAICRLAQLARAAGIHLVIATQRPSVNVITGLIKANVPSRIAFSVSSGVDSRTIIDMNGAEKLLGKGDMLFYPAGFPKPQRVQGAFVSDQEVQKVVDFLTEQGMTANYSTDVERQMDASSSAAAAGSTSSRDEYFEQAGRFIIEKEKASIGMLQRMFKIGFNRAARIMDQLAEIGVVGAEEGTKPRQVLMTMEEFEDMMERRE